MTDTPPMTGSVTSIQRMPSRVPPSGSELAGIYWTWLNTAWGPLVNVRLDEEQVTILALGLPAIVLRTTGPGSYALEGGFLAQPGGVFAFRSFEAEVETALEEFRPALPLWLYRPTHGLAHLWTMQRFRRHLVRREATRP